MSAQLRVTVNDMDTKTSSFLKTYVFNMLFEFEFEFIISLYVIQYIRCVTI